jgi:hypothetical protein
MERNSSLLSFQSFKKQAEKIMREEILEAHLEQPIHLSPVSLFGPS